LGAASDFPLALVTTLTPSRKIKTLIGSFYTLPFDRSSPLSHLA